MLISLQPIRITAAHRPLSHFCYEVEQRWIPAKIALEVNVISGWHCEVAQVTNRLTWSSAVGLEQREDTSSHKSALSTKLARHSKKQSTSGLQCDGFQLDRRC